MKSSERRGGIAGIIAVLLVAGIVAVALVVIQRPQTGASGPDGTLTCQGRPSFVLDDAGTALYALATVGQQDVWAVGTHGPHATILHWDGRSWRHAPLPTLGATASVLFAIAATSPDGVWAVGQADLEPLILHWDGARWARVAAAPISGYSAAFSALAVGGPADVWALGSAAPTRNATPHPIAERWNGGAWSRAEVGQYEARGASLTSLAIGGDGSVWAAGFLRNPSTRLYNALVVHLDAHGNAARTGRGLFPPVTPIRTRTTP